MTTKIMTTLKRLRKKYAVLFPLGVLLFATACSKGNAGAGYITQDEVRAYYLEAPMDMPVPEVPVFDDYEVDICRFGAVGDGQHLNTEAIQTAIDHVSGRGGGTVRIPAGVWATGPIELKSHVRLHTEANALVVFSPDYRLYPIVDTSWEGEDTRRAQSPLSARNAEDIAITGQGVFNGSGDAWRPVKRDKMTAPQFKALLKKGGVLSPDGKVWYPSEASLYASTLCVDQNVPVGLSTDEEWEAIHDFLRPVLLNFISCRRVLLDGVTFENSPSWNLHPLMCDDVVLHKLTVRNPWYSQNGDGVDLESCRNALIADCSFDVGDDAICMKSGKNEDGRRRNRPTENVAVSNCMVYHGHGGFVVGSEMSGDVRAIWVTSCSFIGTDVGLRFKSTRGRGGVVEDIYIEDINMVNIPNEPLLFNLFYGGKARGEDPEAESAVDTSDVPPATVETPAFRNIYIDRITSVGSKTPMFFNGLPEMKVENVHISNSTFSAEYGAEINRTDGITLTNVRIRHEKGDAVNISEVDNAVFDRVADMQGNPASIRRQGNNTNIEIR